MKDTTHSKRRFYAWALLFALCSQRILGLAGSDIVYAVEIEAMMNPAEEAIAEKVREETGFDFQVEIRDEEQVEFLLGLGYSAPFLLSEEIDGQTHYYTVSDSPATTVELVHTGSDLPDAQFPLHPARAAKDRLAADFCFWEPGIEIRQPSLIDVPGTTSPNLGQNPFISVPSPPPQHT